MPLLDTLSNRVILASKSPRRIELLKKVISNFEVRVSNVEEKIENNKHPRKIAVELSRLKAENVASDIDRGIIIGADSIVVLNNKILGKPENANESFKMLKMLSNNSHQVITGFTVIKNPEQIVVSDFEVTEVKFRELESWEIQKYIETNKPFDKAGSYGIQDDAAVFVEYINGCFYNVMGLPTTKLFFVLKPMVYI